MKSLFLGTLLVLCLAACVTAPPPVDIPKPAVEEKKKVDIDPTLVKDCPTVTLVSEAPMSGEDELNLIGTLSSALSVCWHRHHDLSDVAVKAFNLNTPDAASAPTQASTPAISK